MKSGDSQLAQFLSQPEVRRNLRALGKYLAVLAGLVAFYSVLFHLLMLHVEGQRHSWVTGLYWTLTVMTTLGFGDITFSSDTGRLFSLLVLLTGVVLLLTLLPFVFIRFFLAPWLETQVRTRAPRAAPPDIRDHVIICRMDTIVPGLVAKLRAAGIPCFVIEQEPEKAARLAVEGVSVVQGAVDGRSTFEALRVEHARMVVANADDTINSNITLTVREVSATVPIAAIVEHEESVDILSLSGATHVLPLKRQLGEQLANRISVGKAEAHVIATYRDLLIAEFPAQGTPLAGRTVRSSRLREATGVSVIAVWERGRLYPASPATRIESSTVVVVTGTREQIDQLNELLIIYQPNPNPVLVIGGGNVGRAAIRSLKRRDAAVHLIEREPELAQSAAGLADQVFVGDASDRNVLRRAGLESAPSVLLTTHDDAMNIYLAVYCRRLNPDLRIVSRITHERNMEAVLRAGADFVLSYDSLGAESLMALTQGRELLLLGEHLDLYEIAVPASLDGRTLGESGIGARTGLTVIAIDSDEGVVTNPGPGRILRRGMELVAVGSPEQLQRFRETYL